MIVCGAEQMPYYPRDLSHAHYKDFDVQQCTGRPNVEGPNQNMFSFLLLLALAYNSLKYVQAIFNKHFHHFFQSISNILYICIG